MKKDRRSNILQQRNSKGGIDKITYQNYEAFTSNYFNI